MTTYDDPRTQKQTTPYVQSPVPVTTSPGTAKHQSMRSSEIDEAKWEIDYPDIQLGSELGSGAFGMKNTVYIRSAN